jgi:hypothetical protein
MVVQSDLVKNISTKILRYSQGNDIFFQAVFFWERAAVYTCSFLYSFGIFHPQKNGDDNNRNADTKI